MVTRTLLPSVFGTSLRALSPREAFNREVGRLFNGNWYSASDEYPAINVKSNEEEVVVMAELPGFAPDDIELAVEANILTLRGSREGEELNEGEAYHRRERWSGRFERAIALPFKVDSARVEAEFSRGELVIKLPRAEAHKPKKIAIKAA